MSSYRLQPFRFRAATAAAACGFHDGCMTVISSWSVNDKPQRRLDVARELATVWVVHLQRSFRLIRGA
jgi:hypothetical protein